MRLTEEADYPKGVPGQFAVCFWLRSETSWEFEAFNNQQSADTAFDAALHNPETLTVPVDGGRHRSAVVWMLSFFDGDWHIVRQTKGAPEYLDIESGEWG